MHVLFVHQNFPAQFGHIARHLIRTRGWSCTFVSKTPAGEVDGIKKIAYETNGGAGRRPTIAAGRSRMPSGTPTGCTRRARRIRTCGRTSSSATAGSARPCSCPSSIRACRSSITSSSIITRTTRTWTSAPSSRRAELDFLRRAARNAMLLLDLENCRRGYSPTHFQRGLFPEVYRPKIDVIFDGIETDIFHRRRGRPSPGRRPVDPRVDADRHLRQPRVRVDARVRHLHECRPLDLPAVP